MQEHRCIRAAICNCEQAMDSKSSIDEDKVKIEIRCYEWLDGISRPITDLLLSRWHAPLAHFPQIDMTEYEPIGADSSRYFLVLLQALDPCGVGFYGYDLVNLRPHRG